MDSSTGIDTAAHPAPHRDRTTLAALSFAGIAPPLAWSLHLVVNYAFASHFCFPDGQPLNAASFHGLRVLLLLIDGAALVISALAMLIAYRAWQASAEEMAEIGSSMVETGEGRTRFLAIWGILTGMVFFVAVIFDFAGLWILPICG